MTMVRNTSEDLNNLLFEQLERVNDESLTDEELRREENRSKSMVSLADQIINNAKINVEAARLRAEYTGDGEVKSRFLLGDGDD